MKIGIATFAACAALTLPNFCFADDLALRSCVEVYKEATRNYSQAQQESLELARSFNSFCKKDGSVSTSASGVGLEAVVKAIPFKFSASDSNSQQRMEEFCKVGATSYDSWNTQSASSSTVVVEALTNYNNCVQLASSGLHLHVSLNQPDTLLVSGSADNTYDQFISSVAYDDNLMTCVSADFNRTNISQTVHGAVHLSAKKPFAITCTKKAQSVSDGTKFFQRTTLSIASGGNDPLAIVFPSDTLNGFELASQSRIAVAQASADANRAQTTAASLLARGDHLQNQLNGVSVSVYARDLGASNCFGTGADWGSGFRQQVAGTCGSRPSSTASDNIHGGGACGQGAVAFACVNIPQ